MKPSIAPLVLAFGLAITLCTIFPQTSAAEDPVVNGFKLSNLRVEREAILSGGPPRDGIPSIGNPKFISPSEANFMKDDDIARAAHPPR